MAGTPVIGASARHTFAASNEIATLSFSIPFRVSAVPENIQIVPDQSGFTFSDLHLTVIRLGDG